MQQLIVRLRYTLLLVISLLGFSSCLTTRHLPAGTLLLKNNKITFQSDTSSKSAEITQQDLALASKLTTLAKQQPNTKTLGFVKVNLMIYNRFYTDKKKGLSYFLMTKVGEPPVLFDSTLLYPSSRLMQQYLITKGYLQANVFADYHVKRRRATAEYHVIAGPQWTIRQLIFPDTVNSATKVIFHTSPQTVVKQGSPLDNDLLYEEQQRVVRALQDQGYYRFRSDFIYFDADTTIHQHQANVYMKIEQTADSADLKPFKINRVFIYADFDPEKKSDTLHYDTTLYYNWIILQHNVIIKPPTYLTTVFLRSGDYYSRSNVECTFNRLYNLGIFKFINVQWKELPGQKLDASVLITPGKKQNVTAQIEANNIESSLGGGVQLSYASKNVFKEANIFSTTLNAGIEAPVFNGTAIDSIRVNLGAQINFSIPRFAMPFIRPTVSCLTDPHTVLTLQANLDQQTKVYSLANYSLSLGYDWRQSANVKHVLIPVFISYVRPFNISDSFQAELDRDPFLAEAFQQQFITGSSYSYIFNNQKIGSPGNYSYLRLSTELSGTILYALAKTVIQFPVDEQTGKYTIFNNAFSNYFRIESDARHYFDLRKGRLLVTRLDAGIAFNYWNSLAVPYVKQFYVGGTSSMRAWPLRKLGPGAFVDTSTSGYYNNTGDIILEANMEYRFDLISKLKGAIFADAGNIWLRKPDPTKPNGEFNFDTFYKQIALGSGVGLRLDFSYFLIRVDVAFQIYNPGEANGDPWVIKYFDPGSRDWRYNYTNLSLGIGYPF